MYLNRTVGVVIPAHNEAPSIAAVVQELRKQPEVDHIVVCDNASHDATAKLAQSAGATVVRETQKGYGAACLCALSVLPKCDWIVFVDGDGAMRGSDLSQVLLPLNEGAQLVIGSSANAPSTLW
jgi:glycosyltransferase involved in cell wall biosynthesis